MKTTNQIAAGLLGAAIVLGQPLAASAACVQADLQGARWKFDANVAPSEGTLSCHVAIDATGKMTKKVTCVFTPTGQVPVNVTVTGASKLTLSAPGVCVFKGKLVIKAGMDSLAFDLKEAALSAAHDKVVGIGVSANKTFLFTATKIDN